MMLDRRRMPRTAAEVDAPPRLLSFAALLLVTAALLGGCNTMEGIGRDIGAAGGELSETAGEVEEEM